MSDTPRTDAFMQKSEYLSVGQYTITRFDHGDYWIENAAGEGMQMFKACFEREIDAMFKREF